MVSTKHAASEMASRSASTSDDASGVKRAHNAARHRLAPNIAEPPPTKPSEIGNRGSAPFGLRFMMRLIAGLRRSEAGFVRPRRLAWDRCEADRSSDWRTARPKCERSPVAIGRRRARGGANDDVVAENIGEHRRVGLRRGVQPNARDRIEDDKQDAERERSLATRKPKGAVELGVVSLATARPHHMTGDRRESGSRISATCSTEIRLTSTGSRRHACGGKSRLSHPDRSRDLLTAAISSRRFSRRAPNASRTSRRTQLRRRSRSAD